MLPEAAFIWRAICRSHYFDEQVHQALVDGRIRRFTYLSSGQEAVAAAVAAAFVKAGIKPAVFGQHRNHDILCAFGANMAAVRDELLERPTGTTGGVGGDPCHHDLNAEWGKIYGHIGLVGDQVPLATGYAFASGEWVVCFMGDATPEEDVWGPSLGFAVTHNLKVLFVEIDNDLSVITHKREQRRWDSRYVAGAYGLTAAAFFNDDPLALANWMPPVFVSRAPTYLRVATERKYRHVGPGTDRKLTNNRIDKLRPFMGSGGDDIEDRAIAEMKNLWRP